MADSPDKDSKTEEPTEKKIRDAVDKGNVPFSREVPIFASLLAILFYTVFILPGAAGTLSVQLKDLFSKADDFRLDNGGDAMALFQQLFLMAGGVLLPAFALFMVFGLAASVFQNMPSPVLDRIQPKFERISPMGGFKRIFGPKGLVEFGKSLIKILVVSAIIGVVLRNDYLQLLADMFSDPRGIAPEMARLGVKIITVVLIATLVIAVADVFWTRYTWHTDLMMTKQEIKDEVKQSDGDPILKARQRSLARDRARKRMMTQVPRATLVIANPTHYAVALRYVAGQDGAPMVLAKGQDLIALKIRKIAEENGIPVFEDPPLARSMFAQVSVDNFIPTEFYKAVAELVHRVYQSKSKPMSMSGRR